VTAVAIFRNPNTIPFCLTTDLLLNALFLWLLVHRLITVHIQFKCSNMFLILYVALDVSVSLSVSLSVTWMVYSHLDCCRIFSILNKTYEWLLMVAMLLSSFGVKQENRQTDRYYDHCLSSANNLKIPFRYLFTYSLKELSKHEQDIWTLSYLAAHEAPRHVLLTLREIPCTLCVCR